MAELPPNQQPTPPGAPSAADAASSGSGGGSGKLWLLVIVGLIVIVGVAAGAYVLGKSAADASGAKAEGRKQGAAAVLVRYQPGQPAYEAIYTAGQRRGERQGDRRGKRAGLSEGELEGRREGLEQGRKQGELTGQQQGAQNGANAALGGFADWDTNSLYVVTMTTGGDIPYAVRSREQMQPDTGYRVCSQNPQELCAIKIPSD